MLQEGGLKGGPTDTADAFGPCAARTVTLPTQSTRTDVDAREHIIVWARYRKEELSGRYQVLATENPSRDDIVTQDTREWRPPAFAAIPDKGL